MNHCNQNTACQERMSLKIILNELVREGVTADGGQCGVPIVRKLYNFTEQKHLLMSEREMNGCVQNRTLADFNKTCQTQSANSLNTHQC